MLGLVESEVMRIRSVEVVHLSHGEVERGSDPCVYLVRWCM